MEHEDSDTPEKRELVARVGLNVRRMGAQSVMTSQAVAERFGLHTTDFECLDLIYLRKQASAESWPRPPASHRVRRRP
ncbi:hypothetical protein PZN02_006107 (plasmid) [Sinorhizobium garamanticum]|uniref:Uncharacterized protein n=1 Tax=Sinorhizobium garamanticum TaxID=680247 RepID=A0ABY8DQP6_9HYPH|nr:hypothetical protein [Sinorhizobium garamanticum]WEX91840.1 hypothetical protein PZN02_006107 [Sinorhizobium garamanticum]